MHGPAELPMLRSLSSCMRRYLFLDLVTVTQFGSLLALSIQLEEIKDKHHLNASFSYIRFDKMPCLQLSYLLYC